MIGAILGDMIGAPYEFDRGDKTKDFPLFSIVSGFTDDSVMTIAVAEALMDSMGKTDDEIKAALTASMRKWGKRYPNAGYGGMFRHWLRDADPEPYGSFGNGSAMRVSSAGWLYDTMEETCHMARLTAEVTHNHPEGIKGAEAVAAAIFMARNGSSKPEIKEHIISEFGYDLSHTCDEIRPGYHHTETCQETVPEAITAFLEGQGFEDVIRTAVSLGGDCDTLACIAGSMAEAFYGVPEKMAEECRRRLPEDMLKVLERFDETAAGCGETEYHDMFLDGNELIKDAINKYHLHSADEELTAVLEAIRIRMNADGHFIFPVISLEDEENSFFRTVRTKDGKEWYVAFTTDEEYKKGESSEVISNFIDEMIKNILEFDAEGLILDPWGKSFLLTKELISMIIEADGDTEYHIPDDPITAELLEDGSYLKRAIEICGRSRTILNMIKLGRILKESFVWVPCSAILSDRDRDGFARIVTEAMEKGEEIVGRELTAHDDIRLVPDILQSDDNFFFPVFTTAEEMGEYGEGFSKVQIPLMQAMAMASNNEKDMAGIVINPFTEPFDVPKEAFELIAGSENGN